MDNMNNMNINSAIADTMDIGNTNTEQKTGYKQVSMEEGLELMKEDSGYILLDVRRTDEFEEGHIPGAINIPNESIGKEEIDEFLELLDITDI